MAELAHHHVQVARVQAEPVPAGVALRESRAAPGRGVEWLMEVADDVHEEAQRDAGRERRRGAAREDAVVRRERGREVDVRLERRPLARRLVRGLDVHGRVHVVLLAEVVRVERQEEGVREHEGGVGARLHVVGPVGNGHERHGRHGQPRLRRRRRGHQRLRALEGGAVHPLLGDRRDEHMARVPPRQPARRRRAEERADEGGALRDSGATTTSAGHDVSLTHSLAQSLAHSLPPLRGVRWAI